MEQPGNQYCYICGFDFQFDHDKSVRFGSTCSCCVFEYGIDDTVYGNNSFMKYRKEWIEKGLPYQGVLIEDNNWNLDIAISQLTNLNSVNINNYFLASVIKENDHWTSYVDQTEIIEFWKKARES